MMNNKINFSLSIKNIKDIPFQKYTKDFTFNVNGKKYQTTRLFADILSPFVRQLHFVDDSIDEFYIKARIPN